MKMYMIAVHYSSPDKKKLLGFRILDLDSGEMKDYPYNMVQSVVCGNKANIIGITSDKSNQLKGSNGAFDRYPALVNGAVTNRSLVILNTIDNIGYQVSSFNGKIGYATRNDVVRFALKAGIANGKVVEKDSRKFISAINGNYTNIPYENSKLSQGKRAQLKKLDNIVAKQVDAEMAKRKATRTTAATLSLPKVVTGVLADNSLLHMVDDVTGLTVEQKMAYAMMGLRRVRPFCYSVFTCLRRIESEEVKTLAVSLKSLYFNPYFVLEVPISDLLFILIHEIYHISMKHRIREQNRNHDLWNKACDYYVNAVIADEFELTELGECKYAKQSSKSNGQSDVKYKISLPLDCLFNKNVSVDNDTPEKIYEELQNIQHQSQSSGDPGDSSDDSSDDSGESGQSGNGSSNDNQSNDGSESGDDSQEVQESEDKDSGDEGEDGESENGGGNRKGKNKSKGNKNKSSGQSGEPDTDEDLEDELGTGGDSSDSSDEDDGTELEGSEHSDERSDDLDDLANGGDGTKKTFKPKTDEDSDESEEEDGASGPESKDGKQQDDGSGNKKEKENKKSGNQGQDRSKGQEDTNSNNNKGVKGKFRGKEIPDIENDMVDSPDEKAESSDRLEQMANSLLKRAASIHRQSTGSFGGEAGDWIERYVEKVLAPKVKWSAILRNKLTLASQKVNTFASPDKRFRSRGMVLPGPKKLENDTLENVKICIDTSGSISPKDLGIALDQIEQMFKQFKADAELMYWDTQIRAIYEFKEPKELVSKKPMGGGGTDANCIFDYFETTRDYKIGRKKKPKIIIVFTDGYFGTINPKYKRLYRDTIWVINGDVTQFTPPFGTVAPFKTDY